MRISKRKPRQEPPKPFLSKEPWAGFTRHDHPRPKPLPICPNPRCQRAKLCIAPRKSLYCQRTHYSRDEMRDVNASKPKPRDVRRLPPPLPKKATPELRELRELREKAVCDLIRDRVYDMTQRWKAGEFDALYGKYKAGGVLMKPPKREYVELE